MPLPVARELLLYLLLSKNSGAFSGKKSNLSGSGMAATAAAAALCCSCSTFCVHFKMNKYINWEMKVKSLTCICSLCALAHQSCSGPVHIPLPDCRRRLPSETHARTHAKQFIANLWNNIVSIALRARTTDLFTDAHSHWRPSNPSHKHPIRLLHHKCYALWSLSPLSQWRRFVSIRWAFVESFGWNALYTWPAIQCPLFIVHCPLSTVHPVPIRLRLWRSIRKLIRCTRLHRTHFVSIIIIIIRISPRAKDETDWFA